MMQIDMFGITNCPVSSFVNANTPITIYPSSGFTVGDGHKQNPNYGTPIITVGQIQALDGKDLEHINGLNIQGRTRAIYVEHILKSSNRPDGVGGDKIFIAGGYWLVVKIIETWGYWTKAAIVFQGAT